MDMYEIESTFNNFLDMADTLDYQEGAGIKLLSNGSSTTRQALKNEVGLFMLSLVDGLNYVTYEQKHLLDLALEKGFEDADSDNILQMADSINAPYGGDNVTINAFVLHDLMSTKTTHEYTTSASNAMIGIFRLMGKGIMTAGLDTTSLSEMRFDNYISNLELKAVTARRDLEDTANKLIEAQKPEKPAAAKSTVRANIDVSPYIPAGVTLTDNQKEYLSAIVDLINKYGPVDASTVAMHMHKSTSAVSSAVSTLMKKGILDKNDDAKIVIADKKEPSTKNVEGSTSKTNSAKKTTKTAVTKLPVGCLNAKQYKGIHQVKGQEEIICPDGSWLIPVQPGCSYSMDPDHTKMSMMGKYPLQIQSTQDCDFDNPYDSRFNFVLFAFGPRIQAFSTITDLSSNEAKEEITKLAWGADADYRFFKQTDSIAIMTKEVNANQSEYSVLFLLFIRGTQFVSHGQIVIRGKALKTAKEEMATVLNSIIVNGPPEGDEGYKPVVLPQKFALTYRKHETLMLDGIINLPVPDGFKGSTNSSLIGAPRKFSIIPSNYSDYTTAMDASIGMSCVPLMGSLPSFSEAIGKGVCDLALVKMCDTLESQGLMPAQVPQHVAQMTTKGIITFQKTFGEDTKKYQIAKAILWVEKSAYLLSFALNFDEKIADRNDVSMDSLMIFFDWLNRIQLPGEKIYSTSIKKVTSSDNAIAKETVATSKTDSKKATTKTKTGTGKTSSVSEKQPTKKTSCLSGTGSTNNKDILDADKYKGIHHVTGKAERISPLGIWSIEVPPMFSYTMDPACTSKTAVSMMGGYSEGRDHYLLQIQTTKDLNFSEAYEPSFGLTIQEQRVNFIKILDNWDDLKAAAAKKALAEIKNSIISYKVLKQTKDILVEYDDSNRDDEALTIGFTIYCSGTNFGLLGQIDIHGENRAELEVAAITMLKSVEKIKYDYSQICYTPYALQESWGLDFSKGNTFDLSPDVKLPVPDGFHSTNNPAETGGRSFIIVPEGYTFSRNPMDAKTGISGGVGEINLPDTYKAGEIFYWVIGALPPNVLDEHWMTYLARRTDKCTALIQENFDSSREWVLYRILLLAGRNGHIFTMRVNFANGGVTFPAARIDVRNIVSSWINNIQVSGEKSQKTAKTKTAGTKTATGTKAKSAAAPKEMSIYSPEYKKAMKERLLPGEKDLPSEIYCNKIDFRAGDIAENGIRFNLLKDNGPVIEKYKYFLGKVQGAYLEIPEGVTEIESSAFSYDEFQIVKLPRSLRILKQGAFSQCPNLRKVVFQEGIRELGPIIFGECPNIKEVHLPGTVEIIDDSAFKWELLSRRSDITVYLTGASAKKVYENAEKEGFDPPFAMGFVIDGKSYSNLENYIVASERERQAALERQRQEKLKRDEEARKTAQRNSLRQRISELEQERDSAKGLFAGMKRKKIQKEIDELRSQLQRI